MYNSSYPNKHARCIRTYAQAQQPCYSSGNALDLCPETLSSNTFRNISYPNRDYLSIILTLFRPFA